MSFYSKLLTHCRTKDSRLCVGLDPRQYHFEREPTPEMVVEWCKNIVDKVNMFAACFKINLAYFEALSLHGHSIVREVIDYIHTLDSIVIVDGKKGDIHESSSAYARSLYTNLNSDAVTVSPYMGMDAIMPFISYYGRGVFALCHTTEFSNTVQTEEICREVASWTLNNQFGLVVGASDTAKIQRRREQCPDTWFLIPGVGAQHGHLKTTVKAATRCDGYGFLISVSRGVINDPDPAKAAQKYQEEINEYCGVRRARTLLIDTFIRYSVIQEGEFQLKNGQTSRWFFNMGRLNNGAALNALIDCFCDIINSLRIEFDTLFGSAYKGIPIVAGLAMKLNTRPDFAYNRKTPKDHGEYGQVVGDLNQKRVLIIDDVYTSGNSINEAYSIVEQHGGIPVHAVVAVNRGEFLPDNVTSIVDWSPIGFL